MAKGTSAVTSGAAIRKRRQEGELLPLRSGDVVRVRYISIDALLLKGEIPDYLSPIAAATLWAGKDAEAIGRDLDMATQSIKYVHWACELVLVEPKIVENPTKDDEISLDDLEWDDKLAISNWAIAPALAMRSFRRQQARSAEVIQNGETYGQPA